jgi:hypothetical protein
MLIDVIEMRVGCHSFLLKIEVSRNTDPYKGRIITEQISCMSLNKRRSEFLLRRSKKNNAAYEDPSDHLYGLVVRVLGYRSGGPG